MFSLRVTMVFLLATLTLTLSAPEGSELGYNFTDSYDVSSEPIPEDGYMTDLMETRHEDGDERVVFDHITKNPESSGRISVTRTYSQFENKAKITALEITNVKSENGGVVSILSGGVGKDFVTLNFLSEPENGLEYDVKIWCI